MQQTRKSDYISDLIHSTNMSSVEQWTVNSKEHMCLVLGHAYCSIHLNEPLTAYLDEMFTSFVDGEKIDMNRE